MFMLFVLVERWVVRLRRRHAAALAQVPAQHELELTHGTPSQQNLPFEAATKAEQQAIQAELQEGDEEERPLATSLPPLLRRAHIPLDELSLGEKLGAGSFGTVVQATWRGTPVAVKRIHRHHVTSAVKLRLFKAECELLLSLRHPNIVQLLGGCWRASDATVCMVLEYCAGGTLTMALADPDALLTWLHHRLPIAQGVARAMAYLHGHEPPVLHMDLKPDNILLDSTRTEAKLSDFGLSRERHDESTMSAVGTPLFSAPEVLRRERYGEAADTWSYGCVLCCLSTFRARPFPPSDSHEITRRVSEGSLRPRAAGLLAEVVEQCTRACPDERPSFTHLLAVLEDPALAASASVDDETSTSRNYSTGDEMVPASTNITMFSSFTNASVSQPFQFTVPPTPFGSHASRN